MVIKKVKMPRRGRLWSFNYLNKGMVNSPTYVVELSQMELNTLIDTLIVQTHKMSSGSKE